MKSTSVRTNTHIFGFDIKILKCRNWTCGSAVAYLPHAGTSGLLLLTQHDIQCLIVSF
jgi:hypothetical protein